MLQKKLIEKKNRVFTVTEKGLFLHDLKNTIFLHGKFGEPGTYTDAINTPEGYVFLNKTSDRNNLLTLPTEPSDTMSFSASRLEKILSKAKDFCAVSEGRFCLCGVAFYWSSETKDICICASDTLTLYAYGDYKKFVSSECAVMPLAHISANINFLKKQGKGNVKVWYNKDNIYFLAENGDYAVSELLTGVYPNVQSVFPSFSSADKYALNTKELSAAIKTVSPANWVNMGVNTDGFSDFKICGSFESFNLQQKTTAYPSSCFVPCGKLKIILKHFKNSENVYILSDKHPIFIEEGNEVALLMPMC